MTTHEPTEGLAVKSVEDLNETNIDPHIHLDARALSDAPDDSTLASKDNKAEDSDRQGSEKSPEPLYVEFEPGDSRDPVNYSRSRKWAITAIACYSTFIAASTSSAYSLGFSTMTTDLNCTELRATVGLSVYNLGFGLVPLVSSSLSEEFGRQPLYLASATGFTLMYLAIALAQNIQTVIVARFLQGGFGSTWATMVGGTIADIWLPQERGLPMAIFSVAAVGGTGLGPVAAGWIEMNPHLGWRWIQWIQMIHCGVYCIFVPLLMRETRSSILLTRLAKKLRKETGDKRYRARVEDERADLATLIFISCTRPIRLLFTEPVVSSFSLWVGFLWGLMFCMIDSIPGVFSDLHHFNIGEQGTAFISLAIGTALGFGLHFYQDHLYHKFVVKKGPEARLISVCGAAIMLPISIFIYAWCSYARIHWISLIIALTLYIWATYIVYLAVFSYLADCYGPFASSALAGQSLCRNLMGTAFPLFTRQMFARLGYNWANTMFALIATVMVPIPFILYNFGPQIRARSHFSSVVMEREAAAAASTAAQTADEKR
ncbi:Drug transporter [Mycena chlorophos]|uniref:Drug transporter n=1 Tax=Mycena chlorophos TaxID=658473 RepID=A0A8H6VT50_MYCCL|nr:Drug transporter [Mycena chlorophos]